MTVLAFFETREARTLILLSVTGHVSLLPLLYMPGEAVIRSLIVIFHLVLYLRWYDSFHTGEKGLNVVSKIYCLGFVPIVVFDTYLFKNIPAISRFEFLPLMIYSVYCALGLFYGWLQMYSSMSQVLTEKRPKSKRKIN